MYLIVRVALYAICWRRISISREPSCEGGLKAVTKQGSGGKRRVKGAEQEESNLLLQQEETRRTERGAKATKESGVRTEQCDYRT
jgi:hypothetical protein